jgi:hypothetical protein
MARAEKKLAANKYFEFISKHEQWWFKHNACAAVSSFVFLLGYFFLFKFIMSADD